METKTRWTYSINGENYFGEFDTKEEAIKEAVDEANEINSEIYYIGKFKQAIISNYFDIDDLLDSLEQRMDETDFSFVENELVEVSDTKALRTGIEELIDEYCSTKYFTVKDVEEFGNIPNNN